MKQKEIFSNGKNVIYACDQKCNKAYGQGNRPTKIVRHCTDEYYYILSDGELGVAPSTISSYQNTVCKPTSEENMLNEWCINHCERCSSSEAGEKIVLKDWSVCKLVYEIDWATGMDMYYGY